MSPAYSPDGRFLITVHGGIQFWDADSGRLLFTLDESTVFANAVALSPDGATVAAARPT